MMEMVEITQASRSFETNIEAMNTAKQLALRTIKLCANRKALMDFNNISGIRTTEELARSRAAESNWIETLS